MEKLQKRKCKFDSPTVVHERLGTIFHGIKHPVSNSTHQLEQFRGIKYASIPARFRRSRLVSSYPPDVDATRYGYVHLTQATYPSANKFPPRPIAPQAKVRNVESLYGLHPGQYPIESFSQSEFECLNLNITAPAYLSPDSNLPVIVWVHGGGNVGGAGSRWLLDGGHLVRRSMEFNQPIIFVAIK
jgi:carboxylesterase type B